MSSLARIRRRGGSLSTGGWCAAYVPTGGYPGDMVVNQATGTVYVPDNVDAEVSFFGSARGVPLP